MKDQYEFHGDGVRPIKATGTQWIDHKLCAIEQLVVFTANIFSMQFPRLKIQKIVPHFEANLRN